MSYSERDLELIRANPDIVIVEDERATPLPRAVQGKMSEHELQRLVMERCAERAKTQPEWSMIFAIPNGQYRQGQRMEAGLTAGIPDLFCAVPSGPWHGLFLELKISPNRPRTNQMEWMQRLRQRGYRCVVCYDTVESVINAINNYLEGA